MQQRQPQTMSMTLGNVYFPSTDWMDGSCIQIVLDLLAFTGQREWKLPDCECMSNGLKCKDICMINTYENQKVHSDNTLSLFDEDVEDDEDDFEVWYERLRW